MEDDDVISYIPLIGDIYDACKLGWQLGCWLADNGEDRNDKLLLQAWNYMREASDCDDFQEAAGYISGAMNILNNLDTDNLKKYQLVTMFFLMGNGFHLIALCECVIYSRDLDNLRKVRETFDSANQILNQVFEVEITIFTENRDLIRQIRELSRKEIESVSDSKRKWRQQVIALDKALNKWKHRVPIIIFLVLLISGLAIFFALNL